MKSSIKKPLALQLMMLAIVFATSGICRAQETESPPETKTETKTETDWSEWNGTWKPVKGTFAGNALPAAQMESITLIIEDGKYESKLGGVSDKGILKLGEPAEEGKPKTIDIISEEGPNVGKTLPSIYRFEEGMLIVCYSMGETRPEEFVSSQDQPFLIFEYEKQKDE